MREACTQFGIRMKVDPYQLMWWGIEFNCVRLSLVTQRRRDSGIKVARGKFLVNMPHLTPVHNFASLEGIRMHKLGALGSFVMFVGTNNDRRA